MLSSTARTAERLMEFEVQGLTGADYGESAPDRLAQRNGYRDRIWETRAGTAACLQATNRQLVPSPLSSDRRCPFRGATTFGAGEANETVLEAVAAEDVFVANYARDGTLLWATTAGGDSSTGGSGIATAPHGNSYVTGGFLGTAIFGEGQTNQTVLHSGDEELDLFVVKYGR